MKKEYLTNSPLQTKNLGKKIAKEILTGKSEKEGAVVLGLVGELGGGKTTFLKGLAKGLGIKEKILSPTFILMRKFQIPGTKSQTNSKFRILKFKTFYHLDCYRIERTKEILNLGFREIIANPENIVAIEWAERTKKILPRNTLLVKFEFVNEKTRKITVKNDQ